MSFGATELSSNEDQFLFRIVEQLPEPVFLLDAGGLLLWGNTLAQKFFGVSQEEGVGRSALDFVHPDDLELVLRSLDSVQAKEVGTLIEVRVATPSGWRLVEVIGRHVSELGAGALLFCMRDITDRRRYEVATDDAAKFRSLLQNAAVVTMLVSADGKIESVSAALTRLFGHDPDTVEGRYLVELFSAADSVGIELALDTARQDQSSSCVTVDVNCLRHDGLGVVPVELTVVSLIGDPVIDGYAVSMQDKTERALAERELRHTLSLLSATLESTADGLLVVDRQGAIVSFNQRFADLWNIPNEVLRSRDDASAMAYVTEQLVDPEAFLAKIAELYALPTAESVDTLRFRDGRVYERHSRPQRVGDETVGRVWSFRDVTERNKLEESLAFRATHDALTKLANQNLFLEQLEQTVKDTESGGTIAVLFIDVDGLKLINDRYGHIAGDRLLKQVADVLRSGVRPIDTVARMGGDEFAVLVIDVHDEQEVVALTQRILDGLAGKITVDDPTLDISVSIGIAFNRPGLSHLDLLHNADAAMYAAKQQGGARWKQHSNDDVLRSLPEDIALLLADTDKGSA